MMKLIIVAVAVLGLAACGDATVKKNVECKTYAAQSACETDTRCMWHEKDDGTYRCKGKHEGTAE